MTQPNELKFICKICNIITHKDKYPAPNCKCCGSDLNMREVK
jgi:hypothetical protein